MSKLTFTFTIKGRARTFTLTTPITFGRLRSVLKYVSLFEEAAKIDAPAEIFNTRLYQDDEAIEEIFRAALDGNHDGFSWINDVAEGGKVIAALNAITATMNEALSDHQLAAQVREAQATSPPKKRTTSKATKRKAAAKRKPRK